MRVFRLQWRPGQPRAGIRAALCERGRQAERWCQRRRIHGRQGPHAPGRTVRQPRPGAALERRQPCRIQTRHRAVGRPERRHIHHLAGHEQAARERELRSGTARRWLWQAPHPRLAPARLARMAPRERSSSRPRTSAKARSFLEARAHEQQAHTTSYRGVTYQVSASGEAEGIVKDFAVIGSESGLKEAIDTSLGGSSITSASGYVKPPSERDRQRLRSSPKRCSRQFTAQAAWPARAFRCLASCLPTHRPLRCR